MKNWYTRLFPEILLDLFCRSNNFYRTLQVIKQQMKMNVDTVTRYVFISGKATYMYKISRAISASKLQRVQTFPPHQRANKAPAVVADRRNKHIFERTLASYRVTHNVRAASLFSWLLLLASLYLCIVRSKICFDRVHLLIIKSILYIGSFSFTFARKSITCFHMKSIWMEE